MHIYIYTCIHIYMSKKKYMVTQKVRSKQNENAVSLFVYFFTANRCKLSGDSLRKRTICIIQYRCIISGMIMINLYHQKWKRYRYQAVRNWSPRKSSAVTPAAVTPAAVN